MPLRIAVLGVKGLPGPAGVDQVMEEIGSRLVIKGHQVDVFVRPHYMVRNRQMELTTYKGMGLPRSPGIHNKYLDALSHSLAALPRILTGPYNVVYINIIGLSPLALPARLAGKKVVVHTHGMDWNRDKWGPLARRLIRLTAWSGVKLPHMTICVSQEEKRFYEKSFGQPCVYIPNGVSPAVPQAPALIRTWGLAEGNYLLFLSRLVIEKGAHVLLEAWEQLPGELKKGRKLVIAGDSDHPDAYYYQLMTHKDKENVVFTGFVTGQLKAELLSNALCVVQPSTLEGFSVTLCEAMAYGRMILASDIKENIDTVGGLGWTFRTRSAADLARKLAALLQLEPEKLQEEVRQLAAFGKANYSWDNITRRVEAHLLKLFNGSLD